MNATLPQYPPSVVRDNLAGAHTFLNAAQFQCHANGDEYWRDLILRACVDIEHIISELGKPRVEEEEDQLA